MMQGQRDSASADSEQKRTSQRGPLAALRRLAVRQSSSSKPTSPSSLTASAPSQAPSENSLRPNIFGFYNKASSHLSVQDEGQEYSHDISLVSEEVRPNVSCPVSDPYFDTPSINRDIWPVLPEAFVAESTTASNGTNNTQSRLGIGDWTTRLGVGLSDQTNSSQLRPAPARFKTDWISRRERRRFSAGRKRGVSVRYRAGFRRSPEVGRTYTSLARQEIELSRSARRSLSTLGGYTSASARSHHNRRSRGDQLRKSQPGTGRQTGSSFSHHGHTTSSASTQRLQSAPSSSYDPSALFSLGHPPRIQKKNKTNKTKGSSFGATTSAKDFSGTFNSTQTSSNFHTPPASALKTEKEKFQLRYHHAMTNNTKDTSPPISSGSNALYYSPTHVSFSSDWSSDHYIRHQFLAASSRLERGLVSKFTTSTSESFGYGVSREENSIEGIEIRSNIANSCRLTPLYHDASPILSSHDAPSPIEAHFSNDYEDIECSSFQQERLDAQVAHDNSRKRYRSLRNKSRCHVERNGRRPRSSYKRPKAKKRVEHKTLEYQVTEQLLLKSREFSSSHTCESQTGSHYQSMKSSEESHVNSRLRSSTYHSSHRKTPSSSHWPRSMSSLSAIGTMGSFFSDWSFGRQALPPSAICPQTSRRRSADEGVERLSGSHTQPMANISGIYDSESLENLEEIEMGFLPGKNGKPSRFLSSLSGTNFDRAQYNLKSSVLSSVGTIASTRYVEISESYPRSPNQFTHHDQAGLLSPMIASPPLTFDHDNGDESTSISSSSWYDAADASWTEEPQVVEGDSDQPRMNQLNSGDRYMMPSFKTSISAAIVYDSHLPSIKTDKPKEWFKKASHLFASSPDLKSSMTVSLNSRRPYESNNQAFSSHQNPKRRSEDQTLNNGYLDLPDCKSSPTHPRSKHERMRSLPQNLISSIPLHLPIPIQQIRTRTLFKPTDDPNFLSRPPRELKQAWEKSKRYNNKRTSRSSSRNEEKFTDPFAHLEVTKHNFFENFDGMGDNETRTLNRNRTFSIQNATVHTTPGNNLAAPYDEAFNKEVNCLKEDNSRVGITSRRSSTLMSSSFSEDVPESPSLGVHR
ncbi:expressed protein [Phakopsora pachyrhizi]|uniref:Expressed protein n=1 Tax=Phakopsora pachyrhizi TaxID=170000 RepID=A0AAV0BJB3_PHAPC|nr:expressed protein [Phakopsora pachyrhizi]